MERRKFVVNSGLTVLGSLLFPKIAFPKNSLSDINIPEKPKKANRLDWVQVTGRNVEEMVLRGLAALGGIEFFIKKGDRVLVKPNMAWNRTKEQAANTNPEVVAAVVKFCLKAGAAKVIVADNSVNNPLKVYKTSGIEEAAKRAGANIIYLSEDSYRNVAIKGKVLSKIKVMKPVFEADKIINLPVVKHHESSSESACMKNWIGAVGGNRGILHQDIHNSIVDLASYFTPVLNILDATRVLVKNGPQGGGTGDVVVRDTIIFGKDQVALDAIAATFLNIKPAEIDFLKIAEKSGLGVIDFRKLNGDYVKL